MCPGVGVPGVRQLSPACAQAGGQASPAGPGGEGPQLGPLWNLSTLSFCLQSTCCVPQWGRELLGSSPPLGSTIIAALAALEPGVSAHQGPGCFRHPICEMGPWLPLLCWGRVWGAQVGAPAHACVRGLTFLTVLGSSHLGVSSWRRAGEREPSKAQRSLVPDPGHWDQPEGRRVCRWSAASAWFLAGWAARRVLDTADR